MHKCNALAHWRQCTFVQFVRSITEPNSALQSAPGRASLGIRQAVRVMDCSSNTAMAGIESART